YQVMLFEFKDGLNKYFTSLDADVPVRNVEDLIEFNNNDSIELRYFGQERLIEAQKKESIESPEYISILTRMARLVREDGIDRVMAENNLDAFIAPSGEPAWKIDLANGDSNSVGSSSPAAMA